MFIGGEHRSLNDRHLFLINDLNQLLRDTISNYLILFDTNMEFERSLKEFDKYLSNFYEKVYKAESDVLRNKSDKDFWLLSALSRNEIAREAFNDYIYHTH